MRQITRPHPGRFPRRLELRLGHDFKWRRAPGLRSGDGARRAATSSSSKTSSTRDEPSAGSWTCSRSGVRVHWQICALLHKHIAEHLRYPVRYVGIRCAARVPGWVRFGSCGEFPPSPLYRELAVMADRTPPPKRDFSWGKILEDALALDHRHPDPDHLHASQREPGPDHRDRLLDVQPAARSGQRPEDLDPGREGHHRRLQAQNSQRRRREGHSPLFRPSSGRQRPEGGRAPAREGRRDQCDRCKGRRCSDSSSSISRSSSWSGFSSSSSARCRRAVRRRSPSARARRSC